MMIYVKHLFGDIAGKSVILFNPTASKTVWTVTFRTANFLFFGYNLDLTK